MWLRPNVRADVEIKEACSMRTPCNNTKSLYKTNISKHNLTTMSDNISNLRMHYLQKNKLKKYYMPKNKIKKVE